MFWKSKITLLNPLVWLFVGVILKKPDSKHRNQIFSPKTYKINCKFLNISK